MAIEKRSWTLWSTFVLLFIEICAWIGCIVAFSGPLHEGRYAGQVNGMFANNANVKFYWDALSTGGNSYDYTDGNGKTCEGGGKGLLAMMILAFIPLIFLIPLTLCRLLHVQSIIKLFNNIKNILTTELVLTSIITFWYFLGICIWGGTCYQKTTDASGSRDVHPTGFGWLITCFILLLIGLILTVLHKLYGSEIVVSEGLTYEPGHASISTNALPPSTMDSKPMGISSMSSSTPPSGSLPGHNVPLKNLPGNETLGLQTVEI